MITIQGFNELLKKCSTLPEVGGFHVPKGFDNKKGTLLKSSYYIAETEEEDEKMEEMKDIYRSWLDFPLFIAIIEVQLEHHHKSTNEELLEAVIYYLEMDTFLD